MSNDNARRTAETKKRRLEMSMDALRRVLDGATIPEIADLLHRPVRTVDQCLRDLHIPSVFSPKAVSALMGRMAMRTEALLATVHYKPGVYHVRGRDWDPTLSLAEREQRLDDILFAKSQKKRLKLRDKTQAEKDIRLIEALYGQFENRLFASRDMLIAAAFDTGFYFSTEYAPEAPLRREATPEDVKKYCNKIVARYKRTKRGSK